MNEVTDRVKIADILDDIGYPHGRNRCACPIHDGSNKTAMSFTDWGFTCFNCGANGGLIDLVVMLKACTRLDAYLYLRRLAGLPNDPLPAGWKPGIFKDRTPHRVKRDNPAWLELEAKLDAIESRRLALTRSLVNARLGSAKTRHSKTYDVPLERWYAIEQDLQYQLDVLDENHAYWNYKFHRTPRRLNANA